MRSNVLLKIVLLVILSFLLPSMAHVQESPNTYWQKIDTSEGVSHEILGRGYLIDATLSPTRSHILYMATTGLYYQDIETGKIVWEHISNKLILDIAISPSGETIAFLQDDNILHFLNSETGEQQNQFNLPSLQATSLAWNPNRNLLAITDIDGKIYIWDNTSNRSIHTILPLTNNENSAGEINTLNWSPNGIYLAAGDFGGRVFIWSLDARDIIHQTASGISVSALKWNSDTTELGIGDQQGNLVIRSFPDFKILHRASFEPSSPAKISALSYSPDDTQLAVGIENKEFLLLSTDSYERLNLFQPDSPSFSTAGESRESVQIEWLSDNQIIQITTNGNTYVWEIDTGIVENWQFFVPVEEEPTTVSFAPNSEQFAFGTRNGAVYIYDMENEELKRILDPNGLTINTIAWSPDTENLAIGRGKQVLLWNAPNPGIALYDDNHDSRVESVAFSKDNLYLASGSSLPEPEIIIRNLQTLELKKKSLPDNLYGSMALTFSPDSQQIAVGTSNEILIKSVPSLETISSFSDLAGVVVELQWEESEELFWIINSLFNLDTGARFSSVYHVNFPNTTSLDMTPEGVASPIDSFYALDDREIISAVNEKIIRWSYQDSSISHEYYGHTDRVKHITVSPTIKKIISISEDGTVRIWNLDEQEAK